MLNTVRVQFTGIVCFAMKQEQGQLTGVTALLADARRPAAGHHHAEPHPPHVAVLQYYPDQLAASNALEPHLVFRRPGSSREEAVRFLVRKHVEIAGTAGDPPPRVVEGQASGDLPADLHEERDFRWVADSARLGAGGLLAGCLDPQGVPDAVLARFALRGGVLVTGAVEKDGLDPVRNGFFDATVSPPNRLPGFDEALALWSDWEVPANGEEVALEITDLDNGAVEQLVFSCRGLAFGAPLALAVKNVPLADLFELSDAIEPARPPAERGGHFPLHYMLTAPGPQAPWEPRVTTVTDGKPGCPPLRIVV